MKHDSESSHGGRDVAQLLVAFLSDVEPAATHAAKSLIKIVHQRIRKMDSWLQTSDRDDLDRRFSTRSSKTARIF